MESLLTPERYVEGALRLLQFVEARRPTGRRFGADADARWASFQGDLRTADRIELLLRDADAEWPGAFGARAVYDLRAVAEDDPFGAAWPGLDPIAAEELWRGLRASASASASAPAAPDPAAACGAIAAAWGLALRPHPVGAVAPTDRLVVAGPSAIVAAIAAFAAGAGAALDWADQVTVVATPPAHRQLAAAAAALLNAPRPTRLLSAPAAPASDAAPPAPVPGARAVVSDDATPSDRALAVALAAGS
jgi:hypothetical protein